MINNHSEFQYQGYQRSHYLGFLRRMCINQYRDDLLGDLCDDELTDEQCQAVVTNWISVICRDLEAHIRRIPAKAEVASGAMALLHDIEGQRRLLQAVAVELCNAYEGGDDVRVNGILWTVLSQHFKEKMDQLDASGGGRGTHQLQATRRMEQLIQTLEQLRGAAYTSMAELACDLQQEIKQHEMANMPTSIAKIMEYLYVIDSKYQASLDDDYQHIDLVASHIVQPELMMQLQQCLDQLPKELLQALSIKFDLGNEPVFPREVDFRAHYGFGWEAQRKRVAKGLKQLIKCFTQDN